MHVDGEVIFLTQFAQILEFDAFCKTLIPFRDNAIAGFNVKILVIYTFPTLQGSRHTLNTLNVCHVH